MRCCASVPLLLAGAQRRALFPGLCCYPMSPHVGSDFASAEAQDQLNMIFDLLGTPMVRELNPRLRYAACSELPYAVVAEPPCVCACARVCACACARVRARACVHVKL